MTIFYVYEHWRPDKDTCFYVGKGKGTRAFSFKQRNQHHRGICKKLARLGMCVEVRMVSSALSEDDAYDLEKARIKFWRASGVELANKTDGGEGLRNPDSATRMKLRAAHLGRKQTLEAIENAAATRRGKKRGPFSAEWISNISKTMTGRKLTPEHREAIRLGNMNSPKRNNRPPISEEARAKMRARKLGKKQSSAHRAAISAALTGKMKMPEHVANVAAALIRRHSENPQPRKSGRFSKVETVE